MRIRSAALVASCIVIWPAFGQPADTADEVREGHELAALICANCHEAASDQKFRPILQPPAPPFVSIAQRPDINADYLDHFLKTTHRGGGNPKGMPNPDLLDYQVKQVTAYILSLRK